MCPRLGERQVRAVDALVAARQRHVVRITDELHRDVPLVREIAQALPNLGEESGIRLDALFVEVQRRHEVLHPRPVRVSFLVA